MQFWLYSPNATGFEFALGRHNSESSNPQAQNMRWNGGNIQYLRGSWNTITGFSTGVWQHVGMNFEPVGTPLNTFDLFIDDFSTPVATDIPISNSGFCCPLNALLLISRNGDIYLDDLIVDSDPIAPPPPPPEVTISAVVPGVETGLQFISTSGAVHRLESKITTNSGPFRSTGATVVGDGNVMELFDPTGYATSKSYRVVSPEFP